MIFKIAQQYLPVMDIIYKILIIIFNWMAARYYLSHKSRFRNILTQLLIIVSLICLFLNSALFFNFNDVEILSYIMVFSFNLLLFIIIFTWINEKYYKKISFKKANYLLGVIVIYSITKLFFIINYLPRWDSAFYYYCVLNAVKNYDFSLISYLKVFRLGIYPCYAYFSFLSIGQFIDYGNVYFLNIQQHILSIVAIYCFYKIISKFFPNTNSFELSIITLIFSFSPILFTVFLGVFTDTAVIAFYLIFLYCYFYRKSLLLIFSAIVLCTSKDPGFILYFFSVLGILLYNAPKSFNIKKIISEVFKKNIINVYLIIPIIIYAISKKATDLVFLRTIYSLNWNSKGLHVFGINIAIIKERLSQIFLVNFQWIFLLAISLFVLKTFYKYAFLKKPIYLNFTKYYVFILPFLAYLIFNLIFITYANPRYISALIFFDILFFYLSISQIVKKSKFRITILLIILFLNLISVFSTFDPVTLAIFRDSQFSWGNHKKMVPLDEHKFIFMDLLFNRFNKDYNISNNDTILFSGSRYAMGFDAYGDDNFSKDGVVIYIDNISKKRTFKKEGSFVPVVYYNVVSDTKKYNSLPAKGYYLSFMWSANDSVNLKKLKQIYNVSNEKIIKSYGYSLNIYELQKKNL